MRKNKKQIANKVHILDFDLHEWNAYITALGYKPFRASQIFSWLHKQLVSSAQEMKNIPTEIKNDLEENFLWSQNFPQQSFASASDDTARYVIQTDEKKPERKIEAVLLPYENRISACVSTQQGCSFDCSFCASGKISFGGNLTSGEILAQVYLLSRWHSNRDVKNNITNVVFMGMGEPLINYEQSLKAAYMLNSSQGLEIGKRKITFSTVGYFPGIKRFVEEQQPFNLAISVHSLHSEKRKKIMNVEQKYPIAEILDYLTEHRKTLRKNQLTFEYILIENFNMGEKDIQELIKQAKRVNAKVNLIPVNTSYNFFKRPSDESINLFWKKLQESGVVAINRRSPGRDIKAACGMLSFQQK